MWKKILIICGIILFLGGLAGILTLMHLISNGTANAIALDSVPIPGFGPCPIIKLNAQLSTRVMSESDTQVLTVTVLNYCPSPQSVTVDLNAPEFSFSPSESDRTISAVGSNTTSIDWILIPNKLGTFAIAVSLDGGDTVILGVTVVNVFGLPLGLAQLLSSITTALGSFFAPLTFVWGYDKWKERKKRKSEEARLAGATAKTSKPNATRSPRSNKRVRRRQSQ